MAKKSVFEMYDSLKEERLQIMDENGKIVNKELMPKFSNSVLKKIYYYMVFSRMADEKALKMQRSGRISTFAQVKGQEGCQIGAMLGTKKTDWVAPAFRETAAFLYSGGSF